MSIIKKYYWLIPIVGGIISLIGMTVPIWYSTTVWVEYVWIIGIIHHVTGGNVLDWAPIEMLFPSIITTILISLSSVMVITSAIFKYRKKKFLGNTENLWIIMAILKLSAIIGYFFGIQYGFYLNTEIHFWTIYGVQIGFFMPLVGMGLSIIGAIIGKLIDRNSPIIY
ncbi:MAG: hypothetical protein KGD67_02355 [Candidatus Lokiarchaeota archaeon]|nr:hypothetical protein [Candidatus Lokiarchaeota archaeon]